MDDDEVMKMCGFTKIMDGTVGLFECTTCAALTTRDGMMRHDTWHEELRHFIRPESY